MIGALRSLIFSTAFLWDRQIGCISRVNFPGTFFHPFLSVNAGSEKRSQDATWIIQSCWKSLEQGMDACRLDI